MTEPLYLGLITGTILAQEVERVQHSHYGELVVVRTSNGELRTFAADRWRRATKRGKVAAEERSTAIESGFTSTGSKVYTKRKVLDEEC